MSRCDFSVQANADLQEIHDFIARRSPTQALRWIERLCEKCQALADSPLIGQQRDDLLAGLRSFPVGYYLIFYRPAADGVTIERVLHGYRDIPSLFRD